MAVVALGPISRDTGGRTYVVELLRALALEPGVHLTVHVSDPELPLPASCRAVHHRLPWFLPGPAARIAAETALGHFLAGSCDVLLAPLNVIPPTWRGPAVVVQHNVLSFEPGDRHGVGRIRSFYRRRAAAASIRRAEVTLAVSEHLRAVLLRQLPDVEPERVRVARPAVAPALLRGAPSTIKREGATVLAVAALWPHKRLDETVAAFALAAPGLPDPRLLVAGPGRARAVRELLSSADRLGVGDRVELLGHLDHAALARVYRQADALVFLSERESFGLPVLEAMALGIPVVARPIPALREVAGDAAYWIDPQAPAESAADALLDALSPSDERAARLTAGVARAASFTWGATARAVASALHEAPASPGGAVERLGAPPLEEGAAS